MNVIFSPHIDDAILSIGGHILNLIRKGKELKVIYIFSKSNWINPQSDYYNEIIRSGKNIMEVRKAEEKAVINSCKYNVEFWDFESCESEPDKGDYNLIYNRIDKEINSEDTFYFPMGIMHPDHIAIQRIAFEIANIKTFNLLIYEDMPYFPFDNNLNKRLEIYRDLSENEIVEDIDIQEKLKLINCYKSQLDLAWIETISDYANSFDRELHKERLWKICSNDE
ncbi:MAG: PIG-L family deacetylase [Bacteroidales bacterium]|nr:PIG-L family deacetylase [Bacteroidales bacterium]